MHCPLCRTSRTSDFNTQPQWIFKTGDKVFAGPTVHGETVYVGSGDHNEYAINIATGKLLWKFLAGDAVRPSLTVPRAHPHLTSTRAPQVMSNPTLNANGSTVWTGSYDHHVYSLRSNGS